MEKNYKDIHLRFDLSVPSHLNMLAKIDLIKNKYNLSYTQAFMFYFFPIADMWTAKENKEANSVDDSALEELRAILSESKDRNKADSEGQSNETKDILSAAYEANPDDFLYKGKDNEQAEETVPVTNGEGYDENELALLLNEVFSDDENM